MSKVLHESGIDMGSERDHNGESIPFLSINQQMMQAKGNNWIEPLKSKTIYEVPESALSMYVNHFQIDPNNYTLGGKPRKFLMYWMHNKSWGFKDPRTTFTLKAWLDLFPHAKVIHVVRHPASVADSLKRRNSIEGEVHDSRLNDLSFNLNLWKQYVNRCVEQIDALPNQRTLTIRYEDILEGGRTLTDLGRFVGIDLVTNFSQIVRPDRARSVESMELSNVRGLMSRFNYE